MPTLRRLTIPGIQQFREFLERIRRGEKFQDSPALLFDDAYSSPLHSTIRIDKRRFASKFEVAEYLARILKPIDTPEILGDEGLGLWSWLALFYFDQLSPVAADGRRRPRKDYHYISSETNRDRDRHLLSGPFKMYTLHGDHARLLLYPPVHQHGQFVYDLGHRRELITNRGLIEAIDLLYWNKKKNRPKVGATTATRPGNLRRLITIIEQLDFNYDLHGMTGLQILHILPREFDPWRS